MKYPERILKLFLEKSFTLGISKQSIMEHLEDYVGELTDDIKGFIENFTPDDLINADKILDDISHVNHKALQKDKRYLDLPKVYYYNTILKNAIKEADLEDKNPIEITKDDVMRAFTRFMTIVSDDAIDIIAHLKPENIKEIEKLPENIWFGLMDAYNDNELDWILAMTAIARMRYSPAHLSFEEQSSY